MHPKRVLIVSHYYPPHAGGIEIVAQNQARGLAKLGHDVVVVTSSVSRAEVSGRDGAVRVVRVKAWNILQKLGVPFPLFAPRIAVDLFRETERADIVHIHDAFYVSSLWAVVAARVRRKPVVLTQHVAMVTHGMRVITGLQRLVYATTGALIFHLSDKILILNDRVEAFLLDQRVERGKIQWFPNGVDGELFRPATVAEKFASRARYGLDVRKPVVLFVGRYVPKKGYQQVLNAQSEAYQLVFAGGVTSQQSTERAKFLGEVPHDALADIFHAADVFLLPSEGEGFPLTVQEAMASGLPIVMKDDIGYRRYGLDQELVVRLADSNPDTITRAVTELICEPERLRTMAAYSSKFATTQFSWTTLIRQLDAIYDSLLGSGEAFA